NPALAERTRGLPSGGPGRPFGTAEKLTRKGQGIARGLNDHPSHRFAGARMNEVVVLTPERILEVTEDVLRRYGLARATVVDVARALDVSHGSVYRHFPSKASLREAVAKRWLDRLSAPLLKVAEASGPAPARLEKWLRTMFSIKHKRLGDDPEMFATYLALAREACKSVNCHKDCLVDQI